ncbi:MAG: hypothetical protein ACYC77_01960 [Coriobacteriia bacterium]
MKTRVYIAVLLTLSALALGACSAGESGPAYEHEAVRTVERLLDLRVDGSRDASAYADYFADPGLAAALVEGTTAATGTATVPEWETPYVSAVGTDTVDVLVRWIASEEFPEWPQATVFVMRQAADAWLVIDALEPEDPLPGPATEALLGGS